MNKQELIAAIESMTVLELAELVKALEERFGVSAAAPVAVAAAPVAVAQEAPAEVEEQTEFDVILQDVGAEKIKVIKAVREITTLGLREAKEVVDGAPSTILKAVSKEEAENGRKKLEEAGAKVQVK